MATGTIIYNKNQQQIYPVSDGSVIISNASGSKSNVEEDLKKLFQQVSDLSGSSEAVNNIIIKVHYLPADTAEESDPYPDPKSPSGYPDYRCHCLRP